MEFDKITAFLHDTFPLSVHLGVKVEHFDYSSLVLSAPLQINRNYQRTAFGGSLSAVAILSGWALLHLRFRELSMESALVIQKSIFEFNCPVEEDFQVSVEAPPVETWERFLHVFRRRGRARLEILSRVQTSSGVLGAHRGTYVAVRPAEKKSSIISKTPFDTLDRLPHKS